MAQAKKPEMVEFELDGMKFECVKSELLSYKTTKHITIGGPDFYPSLSRLFAGRDEEYCDMLGDTEDAMRRLINAAYKARGEAKN
jgi:hypothetical protein